MSAKCLFAEDLAARWRVHPSTARRWLRGLEARHGPRTVGRMGRRLYTTDDALALVGPGWAALDCAAERLRRLDQRVNKIGRTLIGLRMRVEELEEIVARTIHRK